VVETCATYPKGSLLEQVEKERQNRTWPTLEHSYDKGDGGLVVEAFASP